MKIVFMGTPEHAVTVLKSLREAGHQSLCVVTQPDRPAGRGQKLASPPVKEYTLKNSLPLQQPESLKGNEEFGALLRSIKPDIIIVVAYGKILPRPLLDIPRFGCLNVHASLLPKYRGAAPVQWALLKGENVTGVTVMKIDERLDTGDILLQERVGIEDKDNAETLMKKLFERGSVLLIEALKQIEEGKARYQKQNDAEATFAPAISKESAEIEWRKPAEEIHNRIRALIPWPVAHTFFREKLLKIWESEIHVPSLVSGSMPPGTIVSILKNLGFIISTGSGGLLVRRLQLEGKKVIGAYDFAIGHDVKAGETLPS